MAHETPTALMESGESAEPAAESGTEQLDDSEVTTVVVEVLEQWFDNLSGTDQLPFAD